VTSGNRPVSHYWNSRFLAEGKVWGDSPSKTAVYAADLFRDRRVRTILVPRFSVLETGLMEDAEIHGDEGCHVHVVRYIAASARM